jgi:hypothetical protein
MAFVRTKKVKGHIYYYLVESYMENGTVKQRILKYLGKEIPEEYLGEYRKRGDRASYLKTRGSPPGCPSLNPGEAKGERHGHKKTRKILPD